MNTERRPRHVLVVEDHAVVRQGLHLLLERGGEFVVSGEAATLSEALAPSEDPDLILTDLILAETQGRTVIQALRNRYPKTPILVLSMIDHPAGFAISLTDRELDVLQFVVLGYTRKQIAHSLGISTRTVETNPAALLHLVGVTSRAALVRFALDAGLVELPQPE